MPDTTRQACRKEGPEPQSPRSSHDLENPTADGNGSVAGRDDACQGREGSAMKIASGPAGDRQPAKAVPIRKSDWPGERNSRAWMDALNCGPPGCRVDGPNAAGSRVQVRLKPPDRELF